MVAIRYADAVAPRVSCASTPNVLIITVGQIYESPNSAAEREDRRRDNVTVVDCKGSTLAVKKEKCIHIGDAPRRPENF
jgi:hypothetical protein